MGGQSKQLQETDYATRFWRRVEVTADPNRCWEWTGSLGRGGYGHLRRDKGTVVKAHRMAWELANGSIPTGMVLHSCDNRKCVNPHHLRQGTAADNMRDKAVRNRFNSKLSQNEVREIRAALQVGLFTQLHLAQVYGVDQSTISHIHRQPEYLGV